MGFSWTKASVFISCVLLILIISIFYKHLFFTILVTCPNWELLRDNKVSLKKTADKKQEKYVWQVPTFQSMISNHSRIRILWIWRLYQIGINCSWINSRLWMEITYSPGKSAPVENSDKEKKSIWVPFRLKKQ